MAESRVYACAEANHLHRVALLPTDRSLDMVYLTLVVNISKGAGCVVHRAEVTEETPQGIQGLHVEAQFSNLLRLNGKSHTLFWKSIKLTNTNDLIYA